MKRIGSVLRRLLRPQARDEASHEVHRGGPYRSAAGEHGAGAEPARVVFTPARGSVFWAGEDEEGLLVATTDSLVRLRPGESTPRQLASTRFALHHALGPRGVVWLDWPGERTEVWWLEPGRDSPRRIAEPIGTPEGIVAHEGGVYWGTTDAEFDPGNDKVMLKANGRIFSVRFDGGPPVEVAHRDEHTHPLFADSRGVAWLELGRRSATVSVFEATAAGVAETIRVPLRRQDVRGEATTIDASAMYLYDSRAGGLVAVPRDGGEPRLLARSQQRALALASHDGALYAIVGDARRTSRDLLQVDLATSEVKVLGQFVAEGKCHGLAIGRTAVYVHGGQQLLSVPRRS